MRGIVQMSSQRCGRNSVVECSLPKADVVGSNPIARSFTPSPPDGVFCCHCPPLASVSVDSARRSFPPIDAEQDPVSADRLLTLSLRPASRRVLAAAAQLSSLERQRLTSSCTAPGRPAAHSRFSNAISSRLRSSHETERSCDQHRGGRRRLVAVLLTMDVTLSGLTLPGPALIGRGEGAVPACAAALSGTR